MYDNDDNDVPWDAVSSSPLAISHIDNDDDDDNVDDDNDGYE